MQHDRRRICVKDDAFTSAAPGEFLHAGTGSGFRTRCDYDQPAVANGATKLLGEEIGMNVLPGNLPIEIEAIFELYE